MWLQQMEHSHLCSHMQVTHIHVYDDCQLNHEFLIQNLPKIYFLSTILKE